MRDFAKEREKMVETQLKRRGISDDMVLRAMNTVPRERFVSATSQFMAYNDFPLPIGRGQTVSQPYMVALMTQELGLIGNEKVLEVGTGSGYQAAVLCKLSRKVISVEREKDLAMHAQKNLLSVGCSNVKVIVADGSQGYIYGAPYDAIMVTAGAEKVPQPLLDQLKIGGKLVIPIGGRAAQKLKIISKRNINGEIELHEKISVDCRFVPLKGKYGW